MFGKIRKPYSSPFRYPGAKKRLIPFIIPRLKHSILVEPFVGGGSIFLHANKPFSLISDADKGVSDFWRIVLESKDDEFDSFIISIKESLPSIDKHAQIRNNTDGLSTFLLNRWNFSGIITSGPIGGYEQKSRYTIGCRFNQNKLCLLVKQIRKEFKGRVKVKNSDFEEIVPPPDSVIYCDPPYIEKGNSLYRIGMEIEDHERLSNWLKKQQNLWYLSYDDHELIYSLYKGFKIEKLSTLYTISGSRKGNVNKNEVLISNERT